MHKARTWLLPLLLVAAVWPATASADDARGLLNGYSMTTSAFVEAGQTDYSAFRSDYAIAPRATGIRYTERNGPSDVRLSLLVSCPVEHRLRTTRADESLRGDRMLPEATEPVA